VKTRLITGSTQPKVQLGCPWPQAPARLRQVLANTAYQLEHKVFAADEVAVRFHHQWVVVHPFPNGNGRHARLKLSPQPAHDGGC